MVRWVSGILSPVLLVGLLLGGGCTFFPHSDSSYTPVVVSDGASGAIVVYEKPKNGDLREFYAQRLSFEGVSLWVGNGTLLGRGYKQYSTLSDLKAVADGAGGTIISWSASSVAGGPYSDHVVRVDPHGKVVWQRDFARVSRLISDEDGGAIITNYVDQGRKTAELIRIGTNGDYPWGEESVTLNLGRYVDNSEQMTTDGSGGVIVTWEEFESIQGPDSHSPRIKQRIFSQRIDSRGGLPWGPEATLVYTTPEGIGAEEPQITSDGERGAIIAWQSAPHGPVEAGSPEWLLRDICVQKIDVDGRVMWNEAGVPLGIVKTAQHASPHSPLMTGNGSGGAILVWEDLRKGLAATYAQKVGSSDTAVWPEGGVQVSCVRSNASMVFRQIVSDGQGGAIVSCGFKEVGTGRQGVLVQRLDSTGKTVWSGNGIVVTDSATTAHFLAADGEGGALVCWGEGMSENSNVQRISADGKLLWGEEGIRLDRESKTAR